MRMIMNCDEGWPPQKETPSMTEDLELRQNELRLCKNDGMWLQCASTESKHSKPIVMAAVAQNGLALRFAQYFDVEVVLTAFQQHRGAFDYIPVNLIANPRILACVVMGGFRAIRSVQKHILKANRETILLLVEQNGDVLEFVSDEFKNDKEIVQVAVNSSWKALRYVPNCFRDDFKIVMSAIRQQGGGYALCYASSRLKGNRDIVSMAVKRDGGAFFFASDDLKNDYTIALNAVGQVGSMLEYASDSLKDNHEVVFAAITVDSRALKFASPSIRGGTLKRYIESVVSRYTTSATLFRSSLLLPLRSLSSQTCKIPFLKLSDLGEEALLDFMKALAEYVGVRAGSRWDAMFDAHMNTRYQF